MSSEVVRCERPAEGVALVRLDDAATRNALTPAMKEELIAALGAADADPGVRAIVLSGDEKSFCSGGALDSIERNGVEGVREHFRHGVQRVVEAVAGCEKPVIAAIDGYCFGAGVDIAIACDLRVASAEAKFHTGFLRLALPPVAGGAGLLGATIGTDHALLAYWDGETIDAAKAERLGLVTRAVPRAELEGEALELAGRIARLSPGAVRATKALVRGESLKALRAQYGEAATLGGIAVMGEDYPATLERLKQSKRR